MPLTNIDILVSILFLIYFIASLLLSIDSRVSIVAGLTLLTTAVATDALNIVTISANNLAIYAYYFLAIGVIQQLISLKRKNKKGISSVS